MSFLNCLGIIVPFMSNLKFGLLLNSISYVWSLWFGLLTTFGFKQKICSSHWAHFGAAEEDDEKLAVFEYGFECLRF